MNKILISQWYFWKGICQRFYHDGCSSRAAALTYTSLLSLVPLSVVGLSILSAFPKFQTMGPKIQAFIFHHFVASSGKVIQAYLSNFAKQASQLSFMGIVFLFVAAILMMFTMEKALNHIWRVQQPRHGVAAFLMYWAVLTISPVLVGASVAVSSYIASLSWFSTSELAENHFVLFISPWALSCLAFTLFYIAIPNRKVPIRYGFIAGIFSTFLFEFAKRSFAWYVGSFQTYQLIYGALSAIPIFLVWVYVCWLILLFGAELSYALTYGHHYLSAQTVDPFTQTYRWLGLLWKAQQSGRALSLEKLVRADGMRSQVCPEDLLTWMLKHKIVQSASGGRFILSRDLSRMTLGDLIQLSPWRLPMVNELTLFDDEWNSRLSEAMSKIEAKTAPSLKQSLTEFYS